MHNRTKKRSIACKPSTRRKTGRRPHGTCRLSIFIPFLFLAAEIISPLASAGAEPSANSASLFMQDCRNNPKPSDELHKANLASSNEWICEDYRLMYVSLLEIQMSVSFRIHRMALLNLSDASADDIRILYTTQPAEVRAALESAMDAINSKSMNGILTAMNWTVQNKEFILDNKSLEEAAGGDPYNPPIVITGYIHVHILPATFGIKSAVPYKPDDILAGILGLGAELRLPAVISCAAGHNLTVRHIPPPGYLFGDGIGYPHSSEVAWQIINYQGAHETRREFVLNIAAENATHYSASRISVDILLDFRNVTFLTNGNTEFRININATASFYRISVDSQIQSWFSEYIHLPYVNADLIRLLIKIGMLADDEFYDYLGTVEETVISGITQAFPDLSENPEFHVDFDGLSQNFDVRSLTDSNPILIRISGGFTYLYTPGKPNSLIGDTMNVRLYSIQRVYTTTLPGPAGLGYDAVGEGMLNYTFIFPKNVIIYNATAGGERLSLSKFNGSYVFSVSFGSKDKDKTLRMTFGSDINYPIELLLPYIITIITLSVIWIYLYIAGRKKKQREKAELQESLERGEFAEDDE